MGRKPLPTSGGPPLSLAHLRPAVKDRSRRQLVGSPLLVLRNPHQVLDRPSPKRSILRTLMSCLWPQTLRLSLTGTPQEIGEGQTRKRRRQNHEGEWWLGEGQWQKWLRGRLRRKRQQ
ncbi:hypothetical protein NDU88_003601 [Pleurodeles waltl]|uniref:Uncharacterized protein n=1 Tax=Pleurodeles waltl TaxID=8319 RepID=A0AAV7VEN8_PLEWA|nr:hypothetical protein NDU88_003601 [Pleurodeles waltl]